MDKNTSYAILPDYFSKWTRCKEGQNGKQIFLINGWFEKVGEGKEYETAEVKRRYPFTPAGHEIHRFAKYMMSDSNETQVTSDLSKAIELPEIMSAAKFVFEVMRICHTYKASRFFVDTQDKYSLPYIEVHVKDIFGNLDPHTLKENVEVFEFANVNEVKEEKAQGFYILHERVYCLKNPSYGVEIPSVTLPAVGWFTRERREYLEAKGKGAG